jgi:diguanylate cyclase (GGDEF)-like protein/PAS domain S-box-containing protein
MAGVSNSFANMQAIIDAIPNPIFVKDRFHKIVLLNISACAFFGHSREMLLSRPDSDFFPAEQICIFHKADDLVFATGQDSENEEEVTDGTGRVRHVITRKRLARLHGADYLVASVTDISASRLAEAQNRYLAFHDPLTGLPNRALLKERIEHALLGRDHSCALLYIDLDRFKEVNDTHGHPTGDALIQQFAQRLSVIVGASDTVARLGGDEFAILVFDTSQDPNADEVCRRALIAAGQPFELMGLQIRIGASIGVALAGGEKIEQSEFQRRADVALYQAKNDGKGCFHIFAQALDERLHHRQSLQSALRDALATGTGLEVYYQPIVGISSGEVEGFEALARWQHSKLGVIPPAEFIPIAETSGLVIELGEWVLIRACEDASNWDPPLRLSVNVSTVQFASGDLANTVERVVRQSSLDPTRLELEITESVLIQDPKFTLININRIRALGVQIVLDDFGTGYSSLSYFRQFPFDKVKIDRTFIADMLENSQASSIVQAVISLGRGLNLQVVAEGVETHQQLAALTKQGCTHVQGYLFGRPMPINSFLGSVLRDHRQKFAQ